MIDQKIIDRVLEATDIVDVVGQFVELKRKGARYVGLCPFHDDRHVGNFSVYPAKQVYKCFACDAKGGAVTFLMEHEKMSFADAIRWLGRRKGIDIDDKTVNVEVKRRELPPPLPTLYLPDYMVRATEQRRCNFHTWLHSLPWAAEMRKRVEPVIEAYRVGATKRGWTVFWQLDQSQTARTGHVMLYKDDGHRIKDGYSTDWIHAMLRRDVVRDARGYPVKGDAGEPVPKYPQYGQDVTEVRYCPFGLHLLDKYPSAEVHIVESEKTALVCAIYFGDPEQHLWMACAGMQNLKRGLLEPIIQQRRVIALHPDRDGEASWREKLSELSYELAYINTAVLTLNWKEQDGEKADVADVLIRMLDDEQRARRIQRITNIMPAARLLAERMDLEIIDNGTGQIRDVADQGVARSISPHEEH